MTGPAPDLRAAVQAMGWQLRLATPLHLPERPAGMRACHRLELDDGRMVKARRMDGEASARHQQELRAGLPAAFVPVLGRVGVFLLEPWVEGRPLSEVGATEAQIARAGGLLALLHRQGSAAGTALPFADDVAPLRDFTLATLHSLAEDGHLAPGTVAALAATVREQAPARVPHHLIHTDLCAENIVLDPAGELRVVDNEDLRFGPAGMDLARSWYRSGWFEAGTERQWRTFHQGYLAAGGEADAIRHQPFWRIAAAAVGAVFRLRLGPTGAAAPLRCLELLAGAP